MASIFSHDQTISFTESSSNEDDPLESAPGAIPSLLIPAAAMRRILTLSPLVQLTGAPLH